MDSILAAALAERGELENPMPQPRKVIISWTKFESACHDLIEKIRAVEQRGERRFLRVLPISRGGLVPAAMVAYALDLPTPYMISLCDSVLPHDNERTLIIDDICDTGKTFYHYRQFMPKSYYASVYVKPRGMIYADSWSEIYSHLDWLVFPWAPKDFVNR